MAKCLISSGNPSLRGVRPGAGRVYLTGYGRGVIYCDPAG